MSSQNALGDEVSGESHGEHGRTAGGRAVEAAVVDEVTEREGRLAPTVEMEVQARVDTNHPDAIGEGLTLVEEERLRAREMEIERTRVRFDRRQESDREARTRARAAQLCSRNEGGAEKSLGEGRADPRAGLSRAELGAVNEEAMRMAERLPGWSRAEIARRLALRVERGMELTEAVLELFEELRTATRPDGVTPIAGIGSVEGGEVDIEGTVATLWEPSHSAIAQVGLLEDETGTVKFTSWKKSRQTTVREGERVRMRAVAKNWYNGRCSVAVTSESRLVFPACGKWWAD